MMGGERELVLGTGLLTAMVGFSVGMDPLIIIPIVFQALSMAALQRMAKHDPQLSVVYRRHINRKIYYPASAHFTAPEPIIKKQQ
jgi:type IV secretion system protein VirB3